MSTTEYGLIVPWMSHLLVTDAESSDALAVPEDGEVILGETSVMAGIFLDDEMQLSLKIETGVDGKTSVGADADVRFRGHIAIPSGRLLVANQTMQPLIDTLVDRPSYHIQIMVTELGRAIVVMARPSSPDRLAAR